VHDVITAVNGQTIEGVEQLKRILRETPAGRMVQITVVRDGATIVLSIKLADRAQVEAQAWQRRYTLPEPPPQPRSEGFVGSASPAAAPQGFVGGWSVFAPSFTLGTVVEPLGSQLAEFFGVDNGLLVKSVDKNSAAANAGLRAGDVVLKFNQDALVTRDDWERDIRGNVGKQAQITILRDKKQMTLTMQVELKKHGALVMPALSPDAVKQIVAQAQKELQQLQNDMESEER
jgi:C-terminal processing protease CtpA/Prc